MHKKDRLDFKNAKTHDAVCDGQQRSMSLWETKNEIMLD